MAGKSRAVLDKEKEKELRAKAKFDEDKRAKEEAALLKPVQVQKVPFGVDPKSILCVYFKAGNCEKGNKCKFSHNLDVERKVEKRNLYGGEETEESKGESVSSYQYSANHPPDTMETWDEEKLRNVVLSKHGNPRTTTDVGELCPVSLLNLNQP